MSKCLIACICEGGAEHAIMDILLDNNAIIFSKSDLLDEKIYVPALLKILNKNS